jgi:phosphoribosyl-ATP pyrophosphohydrolase/phosphoribosyl-AMP cyclohydrolase
MNVETLAWEKMEGLIPAVVQDEKTRKILMLGYMNQESLAMTLASKRVTFYSRSKKALWTKGETSGHFLTLCDIYPDCDGDSLLILATPLGPTCHQGTASCFVQDDVQADVITQLEKTIQQRQQQPQAGSYVCSLLEKGIARMAQKVGEEGVEVALAAVAENKQSLCEEVADLLFHVLVLLQAKELSFNEILNVLARRAQPQQATT